MKSSIDLWPLALWVSQLLVTVPILAYATRRIFTGAYPGPVLTIAAVTALLWTALVMVLVLQRPGRLWIMRRKWELLLSASILTLTFAVLDAALTFSGTVPTIAAIRARSLEYRASVSTRHRLKTKVIPRDNAAAVQINGRGLRGKEIEASPPEERLRFLFLGGSQVFDFDHDWTRTLERILEQEGHEVEILNAAVPGHATSDSLGKLTTDLWLLEPDLIFTCHAWNDIKYFGSLSKDLPYRDFVRPFKEDWRLHPRGLDRLVSHFALYRRYRNQFIREMTGAEGRRPSLASDGAGKVGPDQFRLNLFTISHVARLLGAVSVLCKQARLPIHTSSEDDRSRIGYGSVGMNHDDLVEAFAITDRIVDEVAGGGRAHVLDMSGPLTGRPEVFRDHVHFTCDGSREAAHLVADRLLDIYLEDKANLTSILGMKGGSENTLE